MLLQVLVSLVVVTIHVVSAFAADAASNPSLTDPLARQLELKRAGLVERLVRVLLMKGQTAEAGRLLAPEVKRITAETSKGSLAVEDARLLYFAGIVEEMSGDARRRDELFTTVRHLSPADEFVHLVLGLVFDEFHREDIAETELQTVLELEPHDSRLDAVALRILAHLASTNRRHARAAELFERYLVVVRTLSNVDMTQADLLTFEYMRDVSRGYVMLEEKRPDAWQSALKEAERAWQLDPKRIEACVLGERIARACRDKTRAEELARTWRERSESVADRIRADINVDPHNPNPYNALAWFLAELDRNHDEGIRAAGRALELRPAECAYIDTLAECQFKKGDVRAAAATIRRVIEIYPYANDYYRRQLDRFEAALKKSAAAGGP